MNLRRKLLKHPTTQRFAARLLSTYIRLVYVTSRKIYNVAPGAAAYLNGEKSGIFAFWHGRMMMMPTICPPRRKMRVLISHHNDGVLISSVIGHFNQATISGSTSRGGREAVMEIIRALEAGDNISITPDGPRGPAQLASKGTTSIARWSGKPLLPVTFSATRHRRLKSWDGFFLALPFGRIEFFVGEPIVVPQDADKQVEETMRLTFEQAMNTLVTQADGAAHG